ncbi:hypothetical protein ACFFX0_05305 [Citricoccus parietis]|uniref:Uncharacterized protein n=1 Tax=Citricoccus parietis TaxID=592307 RepID=A0ABV5FW06_9MICC
MVPRVARRGHRSVPVRPGRWVWCGKVHRLRHGTILTLGHPAAVIVLTPDQTHPTQGCVSFKFRPVRRGRRHVCRLRAALCAPSGMSFPRRISTGR